MAIDGEPAGVAVAIPNLNEMIKDANGKLFPFGLPKLLYRLKVKGPRSARLVLLGIRKKWRHVRKYAAMSAYMYAEMNEGGKRLGIKCGELGWTLEDNGAMNAGIKMMGGKQYKRYRVYQKSYQHRQLPLRGGRGSPCPCSQVWPATAKRYCRRHS